MPYPISAPGGKSTPKYYIPYRIVAASDASAESKAKAHYVCDGVNDEEEINQAINDLPSQGGIIFLTEGTFNLSNNIWITKNNIIMSGSGDGTVLKVVGSVNSAIRIGDHGNSYSNFLLENFKIIGKTNQTDSSNEWDNNGIIFDYNIHNAVVRNVTINNARARGIYINVNSENITIENCRIYGNFYKGYSIYSCTAKKIDIVNSYIENTTTASAIGACYFWYTDEVRILKNVIICENGDYSFRTASGSYKSYYSIIGNYIKGARVTFADKQYSIFSNNIIIQTTGTKAFEIVHVKHSIFSNNFVFSSLSGSYGFYIKNCSSSQISNNCMIMTDSTSPGLYMNNCSNLDVLSNLMSTDIEISNCTNCRAINNTVSGYSITNSDDIIYDSGNGFNNIHFKFNTCSFT